MIACYRSLIVLACLFGHATSWADEPTPQSSSSFVRIEWGDRQPLAQGDTSGCGPVSLLNLLHLGPQPFQQAFNQLASDQGRSTLDQLVDKYCTSDGSNGTIRYSHESGINDSNLTRLCNEVARDYDLGPIDTLYTNRLDDESDQEFAGRINARLLHSLKAGIPVVISIDSYAVRDKQWEKLTGHYLLLTGIQPLSATNRVSFLIEYIDPVEARHCQALVYGSSRRYSRALAHFPEGDRWLDNNPYLYIAAPALDLRESRQAEHLRHAYFLTIVFGRLGQK